MILPQVPRSKLYRGLYDMAYRRAEPMVDNRRNGGSQPSASRDEEQLLRLSDSILSALDMEDVEDANIVFERPLSHPRPATFD